MTEELIERFFRKDCTAQEAAAVADYLKNNPAILEKYLDPGEWFGAGVKEMPAEFWENNWNAINEKKSAVRSIVWLRRSAAAAVAVLVVGAGFLYTGIHVKPASPVVASVELPALRSDRKITVNNSATMMHLNLPDSSEVALSPGSLITYYVPFAEDKRDITLDGEARFTVKKNEHKPFTVFAGGLATTALGTEFTINTKNNVSVKLHNGRVKIIATGEIRKYWRKDVILEPGQQLNYDLKEMTGVVELIKPEKKTPGAIAVKKLRKAAPAQTQGLNFVNTSLPEVMGRLTAYYHEKINFDNSALEHMNFTGSISPNDSLNIVLKVIAQMNDLQLGHDENGYQLSKTGK